MLNRRWIPVAAALLAALLGTAACGTAATTATATGAKAAPVTISAMFWDTGFGLKNDEQPFAVFEKDHPNVKVSFTDVPAHMNTKLLTEFATGTAPDTFEVGDTNAAVYVHDGAMLNLDPYIRQSNFNTAQFIAGVGQTGMINGKYYYFTKNWATEAIMYNKALFRAAHIPYPKAGWTWQQFYNDAKALTKIRGGRRVQWGVELNGTWLRGLEPLIYQGGGSFLNKNGTSAKGHLDSTQTIKAMRYYISFYRNHLTPSPTTLASLPGVDLFATGKVAMDWTGPWSINTWTSDKNLHFGVVPLPRGPAGYADSICWAGFGIYSKSKHPHSTWEALQVLGGPVGQKIFAAEGFPAIASVAKSLHMTTNPYYAPFFAQTKYLHPLAPLKTIYWTRDVVPPLQSAINAMIRGAPVAKTMRQTTATIDAKLQASLSHAG